MLEITPEIEQQWLEVLPKLKEQIRQSEFPIKVRVSFGAILYILESSLTDRVKTCEWFASGDEESDEWDSSCGGGFTFYSDGPIANGVKFCPFCGHRLVEKEIASE